MNIEGIYIPPDAREHIRAILPFATSVRPSSAGGWQMEFQIKEDHANWKIDEHFLAANNLTLKWDVDRGRFDNIAGWVGTPTIKFTLIYRP